MQNILLTKPYTFVPPVRSHFWVNALNAVLPGYLRRVWGIERVEVRGVELLQSSRASGNGVLLAPNHCRPCDPMLLGMLSRSAGTPFYIMASAHLFEQSRFQRWLLPRIGAFSIYREGLDRAALDTAMEILEHGERPLLVFPEGMISRSNDRLNVLQEGTALMVKGALKRRAGKEAPADGGESAPPRGGVAVHPVAIRYFFGGDVEKAVLPVLRAIESRLTWFPQSTLSLPDRIRKIGEALVCLKELEYVRAPQSGTITERLAQIIDTMLAPLEAEYFKGQVSKGTGGKGPSAAVGRVKKLRSVILPDIIKGEVDEAEKERRWQQLAVCYYAQALSLYPPDYILGDVPPEHILETVERFEEDLTDVATIHRPMHAVIEVRPPLVLPATDEGLKRTGEIVPYIEAELETGIAGLKSARPS